MDANGTANIGKMAWEAASASTPAAAHAVAEPASAVKRREAAQEFASLLFLEVLKAMRAALPQEGLLESESLSRDIYSAMMDAEIAKVMAKRDATGFVKTVDKSLAKAVAQPQELSAVGAPVDGVVSSVFGARKDPFTGSEKLHSGIDINAPSGTPISPEIVVSGLAKGSKLSSTV
jgi:murein DD-endopeptidase MepM/ murein hydrolase activator NlpD